MRWGGTALLSTAVLATAACVTDSAKLTIRPLADPYTKATKAGSPAVAEGRGLLAVGSVGLAIEAFRKALRDDPKSIEALAGLAECYDQMGRHDLSQAKYEAALAIAPNDPTLLRTFAASLERQGRFAEAKELRGEAATAENVQAVALVRPASVAPSYVLAQPAPGPTKVAIVQPQPSPIKIAIVQPVPNRVAITAPVVEPQSIAMSQRPVPLQMASKPLVTSTAWAVDVAPIAPPPPAPAASVTVKLPPPAPPIAETPKIAAAAPTSVETPKVAVLSPPRVEPAKVADVAPQAVPAKVEPVAPLSAEPIKVAAAAPSVTMKLPAARPAAAPTPEKPAEPAVRQIAEAVPMKVGPRLERLSMGEVALLTDPRPRWRNEARQVAIGTRPRFVSLAELQPGYGLRLLNAARHEGLAARTRLALNRQGWKSVTIGDSARIRQRSLVLYSEKTERQARRLAAQFGFWIAREARPGPLTILLGRDWANRSQSRA